MINITPLFYIMVLLFYLWTFIDFAILLLVFTCIFIIVVWFLINFICHFRNKIAFNSKPDIYLILIKLIALLLSQWEKERYSNDSIKFPG